MKIDTTYPISLRIIRQWAGNENNVREISMDNFIKYLSTAIDSGTHSSYHELVQSTKRVMPYGYLDYILDYIEIHLRFLSKEGFDHRAFLIKQDKPDKGAGSR